MTKQQILKQEYCWESVVDIERDVYEAVELVGLPGEFTGTLRVIVEYIKETDET
tara:strand:- start:400 stop:561 length:162 start_codon:yes stop_codon:yes gene_type:complete